MSNVLSIEDKKQEQIQKMLPDIVEYLNGPRHMSYYIGNGRDGFVFKMFNPHDFHDDRWDNYAIKIWNSAFKRREEEVEILRHLSSQNTKTFEVPKFVAVDHTLGCFVMQRIPGKTCHQALFRGKTEVTPGFYGEITRAFRELHSLGVTHADAHTGNYLFTEIETVPDHPKIIESAKIWIIDFGRSIMSSDGGNDLGQIAVNLKNKIAKDV